MQVDIIPLKEYWSQEATLSMQDVSLDSDGDEEEETEKEEEDLLSLIRAVAQSGKSPRPEFQYGHKASRGTTKAAKTRTSTPQTGGSAVQQRQRQINDWIDQVTLRKNGFCRKGEHPGFASTDILRMIEFGDYFFVGHRANNVISFAIAVDHPGSYQIWGREFGKPHGNLEVALICSNEKQAGKNLMGHIVKFCRTILLRKEVRLFSLPPIVTLYESWGFEKSRVTGTGTYMKRILHGTTTIARGKGSGKR